MFAVIFFLIYIGMSQSASYENEYGPLYGEEWLLMADEEGFPYFVNFTYLPEEANETRASMPSDIYYYLYTRNNTEEPESLTVKNNTVQSQYFNPANDLKVLTHGWMSSGDTDWLLGIKNTYLKTRDINVIALDWGNLARNPFYPWPAMSTRYVGKKLAEMLDGLQNSYGISGEKMHLIGHSLGAQIMGYAGTYSKDNISRITGLDPARPLFEIPDMGDRARLERSDANYVDIIHTCGGVLGYKGSFGHADFYPNDGKPAQPGCEGVQYMLEACSHGRSYQLFEESIPSSGFKAYRCETWQKFQNGECPNSDNRLGEHVDTTKMGDYYLSTNAQSKFCQDE